MQAHIVRPYGYVCAVGLHGVPKSSHPTVSFYASLNRNGEWLTVTIIFHPQFSILN